MRITGSRSDRPGGSFVSPKRRIAARCCSSARCCGRRSRNCVSIGRRSGRCRGLIRAYRGGDDKLISGVASIAESGGLRVVGVKDVAPEVFVPEGVSAVIGHRERDRADIARALDVIAALGPFDVGQAAVVADNNVLAVEAAEGTDNLLNRIAELRRLGRVTSPPGIGVLVKAPKPGQDRRFDLPSIGPRTVENVARAGLAGLAVTAGSTMIAEAEAVTAAADRERIFLVGVREDTAR